MCDLLGWGLWGLVGPESVKMLAQADVDKFITTDVWYRLRVCALGVIIQVSFICNILMYSSTRHEPKTPPPPNKQ